MDVKTSRSFAAFLEEEMFETELRNALLRDIRSGAFAPGKMSAPFMTLRISLQAIDAPQSVLDRLREADAGSAAPTADMLTEARAAAARMQAAGVAAFTPPTLTEQQRDDAQDSATDMLLPNSAFIDARYAESERETERLVRALQSGEISADFELKYDGRDGGDDASPQ